MRYTYGAGALEPRAHPEPTMTTAADLTATITAAATAWTSMGAAYAITLAEVSDIAADAGVDVEAVVAAAREAGVAIV